MQASQASKLNLRVLRQSRAYLFVVAFAAITMLAFVASSKKPAPQPLTVEVLLDRETGSGSAEQVEQELRRWLLTEKPDGKAPDSTPAPLAGSLEIEVRWPESEETPAGHHPPSQFERPAVAIRVDGEQISAGVLNRHIEAALASRNDKIEAAARSEFELARAEARELRKHLNAAEREIDRFVQEHFRGQAASVQGSGAGHELAAHAEQSQPGPAGEHRGGQGGPARAAQTDEAGPAFPGSNMAAGRPAATPAISQGRAGSDFGGEARGQDTGAAPVDETAEPAAEEQELAAVREQLATLIGTRERMLLSRTPEHPVVVNVTQQILALEEIRARLEKMVARQVAQRQAAEKDQEQQQPASPAVAAQPQRSETPASPPPTPRQSIRDGRLEGYRQLTAERDHLAAQYQHALAAADEAEARLRAAARQRWQVSRWAVPPRTVGSMRQASVGVGLLIATLCGFSLASFGGLRNRFLWSQRDLAESTDLPVVAVVPATASTPAPVDVDLPAAARIARLTSEVALASLLLVAMVMVAGG